MIDAEATGLKIKNRIKESDYTCDRLAEIIGITTTAMRKWFKGVCLPSIDNFVILADALGCKIDDFIVKREYSEKEKKHE